MPTTVSHEELEQLVVLLREHRDSTGESVTSIAERAGVRRGQLSQLISGSYAHTPQFEVVCRIARAIGRKVSFPSAD